jgi:hypothetical protein
MKLLYDKSDLPHAKKLGDNRFSWLEDMGGTELEQAALDDAGFLFGYEYGDPRSDRHSRLGSSRQISSATATTNGISWKPGQGPRRARLMKPSSSSSPTSCGAGRRNFARMQSADPSDDHPGSRAVSK